MVIEVVQQAYPEFSIRQLCAWLGVSRRWYYRHPSAEEQAERDLALRGATDA